MRQDIRRQYEERIATLLNDPRRLAVGEMRLGDPTLLSQGRGRGYRLYLEDCRRDAHYTAVEDKLKNTIIGRPWRVVPSSDSEQDLAIANFVKAQLNQINFGEEYGGFAGFDGLTYYLLDAVLLGIQPAEVDWQSRGSEWRVQGVRPLDPERIIYYVDRQTGLPQLRLRTRLAPLEGIVPPVRKFLSVVYRGSSLNPYGVGKGQEIWWCVFFKRNGGIIPWGDYNESFASPTPVVEHPPGATDEDKAAALLIAQSVHSRTGVAISSNMVLRLLEAVRTGTHATYEAWCRYWDEQISATLLGESATTNQTDSGGSRARDESAGDQLTATAKAYSDLLHASLEGSLVRWIVDLNFGENVPTPRLERDWDDAEDLNSRSERDERLHRMGFRLTLEAVRRVYGDDYEAIPAPNQSPLSDALPGQPAQFARRGYPDQEAIDATLSGLEADWLQGQVEGLITPIQALIDGSTTPERVYGELATLFPEMDDDELQEALERVIFVADIWGRLNSGANR